ncbi:hypothetical protein SAY86_023757 [Trapa natans]|uniref:Uncharacterized protein n=1 Tax=Trapa natans TaxID=22666 RepID=A0AAN7R863_TRANT|nr:hypothetical protein SAY86_023757 [Trapa natans]
MEGRREEVGRERVVRQVITRVRCPMVLMKGSRVNHRFLFFCINTSGTPCLSLEDYYHLSESVDPELLEQAAAGL